MVDEVTPKPQAGAAGPQGHAEASCGGGEPAPSPVAGALRSDSGDSFNPDRDEVGRLVSEVRGRVQEDAPLAPLTTFCIGGPARLLVAPADEGDIVTVLSFCRSTGAPLYVLGGGSNVLVPDEGVEGVVLRTAGALDRLAVEDGLIVAGAGVGDERLSEFALGLSHTGFEWIFDIPGTVGGAVYMNAGNSDGEMKDGLVRVRWLAPDGKGCEGDAASLDLGYRASRFQERPGIIVKAWLRLGARDDAGAIRGRMEAIRDLRSRSGVPGRCSGGLQGITRAS
ncbi:MAG: FAD-binding protein [Deltaproteobacteria bacterium]|nr:FAD-binding protein [Deltaproteobacteria bacterium]